jgi:hypothetical protein
VCTVGIAMSALGFVITCAHHLGGRRRGEPALE